MSMTYYSKNYQNRKERENAWKKRNTIPLNYSTSRALLDILLDFGENFPIGSHRQLHRWAMGYPKPPRWRLNRAMKYLESLGQVKVIKENDQLFLQLTKKGKLRALLLRINKGYRKESRWDGKWRLIIWDIPESSNKQRDRIRYFLKNLGFYRLQHSVFITPYPLPQLAVEYLKESELLKFIRFLRVDKIDDDKFLRKHFGLI